MSRSAIRGRFLWLLKNTLNPITSRIALTGHGPFSLVRHVGRKSGRTYETFRQVLKAAGRERFRLLRTV